MLSVVRIITRSTRAVSPTASEPAERPHVARFVKCSPTLLPVSRFPNLDAQSRMSGAGGQGAPRPKFGIPESRDLSEMVGGKQVSPSAFQKSVLWSSHWRVLLGFLPAYFFVPLVVGIDARVRPFSFFVVVPLVRRVFFFVRGRLHKDE
ncbi:hypothetical protein LZ31DRAFT_64032 [Colletotrichum somersetense]|nr:hypothetical protein LZ31DRAFT_64032 [Colletotrichum somersetense]